MNARVELDEAGMEKFKHSIMDACDTVTDLVTADAIAHAARRTGRMAGSTRNDGNAETGYTVVADTEYSAYVELGTEDAPAQPFLRPALHHEYEITN
jgi:HK97 gp10 family phage protein